MNYIEQVAKMLDVEKGEKFEIRTKTSSLGIYSFTKTALVDKNNHFVKSDILVALLNGKYTIKKLNSLWKPKDRETYYVPYLILGHARRYCWGDNELDNIFYKRGLIFKTEEEADNLCKEILKFVKEYKGE